MISLECIELIADPCPSHVRHLDKRLEFRGSKMGKAGECQTLRPSPKRLRLHVFGYCGPKPQLTAVQVGEDRYAADIRVAATGGQDRLACLLARRVVRCLERCSRH